LAKSLGIVTKDPGSYPAYFGPKINLSFAQAGKLFIHGAMVTLTYALREKKIAFLFKKFENKFILNSLIHLEN